MPPGGTCGHADGHRRRRTHAPALFELLDERVELENRHALECRNDLPPIVHSPTPEAVRTLLHDGGAQNIDVAAEDGYQALRTPEDFWTMALGSGLRWTIDQMGTELAREVKHEILDRLAAAGVDRVETNVIYAIAGRSPSEHSALP